METTTVTLVLLLCVTATVAQERTTLVRCPNLSPPTGGRMVGECSEPRVGDECFIECDSGYRTIGPRKVICVTGSPNERTGRWDTQFGRCERLTCPMLQPPQNGQVNGQCTMAQPGNVCNIVCSSGYSIQGSNRLSCMEDGQWSGAVPTCIRTANQQGVNSNRPLSQGISTSCPDINAPINGMVSGMCAMARNGDMCKFTCLAGFQLQGLPSLVCNPDFSWSGAVPSCY